MKISILIALFSLCAFARPLEPIPDCDRGTYAVHSVEISPPNKQGKQEVRFTVRDGKSKKAKAGVEYKIAIDPGCGQPLDKVLETVLMSQREKRDVCISTYRSGNKSSVSVKLAPQNETGVRKTEVGSCERPVLISVTDQLGNTRRVEHSVLRGGVQRDGSQIAGDQKSDGKNKKHLAR